MKRTKLMREMPLHLMILPSIIILLIFSYVPMGGLIIAFEKFSPAKGFFGSKWVGLNNFTYLIHLPGVFQVLYNTVFIAILKIIAGIIVPLTFALLLNEVSISKFKRTVQTIIYLPHFLSWIILTGILIDFLSPSDGLVNGAIKALGFKSIFFLGSEKWFPYIMVITDTWKEFGFGTIIYLAALTSIDPTHYEAAVIDGAGRWKQTWYVTIPGILPIIVLMTVLSLGSVLNAGFDQIFNMYSPAVYHTGDIIDTFIYRLGIEQAEYGPSTAAGFFKSLVSLFFITTSYKLADKFAGYKIF